MTDTLPTGAADTLMPATQQAVRTGAVSGAQTMPVAEKLAQAISMGAAPMPTTPDQWDALIAQFTTPFALRTSPQQINPERVITPGGSTGATKATASTPAASGGGGGGATGDLQAFLYGERMAESSNNYTVGDGGAYGMIEPYWQGTAKAAGYGQYANAPAGSAPPAVQDAVASYLAQQNFQQYGTWAHAAQAWYNPATVGQDGYTPQGNVLTMGQYSSRVMGFMQQYPGGGGTPAANPNTNPAAPPATSLGSSSAIQFAQSKIGENYVWGGESDAGWDCLARGTMVQTDEGEVPIEDIRPGDLVLTRAGYRPVTRAWMVREAAETVEVDLGNGRTLCGTGDHRVWTENRGWVYLKTLTATDKLLMCIRPAVASVSCSRESGTTGTPGPIASPSGSISRPTGERTADALRRSIGRCGSRLMARFQQAMRSTTETATRSTTPWRTLSAYLARITGGIPLTPASCMSSFATSAGASSWPSRTRVRRDGSARSRASSGQCGTRSTQGPSADVFDLTVDGEHEFFANGVLVHNCSGLVQAAYKAAGVDLPRVAQDQYNATTKVPNGQPLQAGDLVFFGTSTGDISHVGIYVGNGQMIDAPNSDAKVRTENYQWADFVGATRPTDATGATTTAPVTSASAGAPSQPNVATYQQVLGHIQAALANLVPGGLK